MAEYQRIVSYLYEYSNGMKGENAGFAKIEKRQKQLRLYFHVKTNDEALTYKIYFYRFRHGTMEGILLDSFQRNDTIIEFKNTYPLVVDLDQVDGFLIYHSNSHFFGSEWNDKPITIRNFLPTEDMAKNPEADRTEEVRKSDAVQREVTRESQETGRTEVPVPETQEPPEPAQGESLSGSAPADTEPSEPAQEDSMPESRPVQNPSPSDEDVPEEDEEEPPSGAPDPPPIEDPFDELPQEIPIPAGTPDTKSTVPEPAPEPAGLPPRVYVEPEIPESEPMSAESLTEEDTSEEEPPEEKAAGQHEERIADPDSKLAEYIEALQLEKKAKEQGVPNTPSLFDWKEYPTLPLPPSYMLDPSIKIKVEDLQNIPHVPENMKTNGFLLLNYGNYGHLMLCQHRQTNRIYLGVPGVFDNEKNFIAKLFGFRDFLTVPESCQKTGNFGYWILSL
ncbi:DUF6128 domain-containing protein [Anaerostipes caccae]|uniref:DUF6128 domain-containing protein n=1 Tax=Anaerostipes caccae TaxID=105841 RepID=UPI001F1CAD48|nr:DUF6128 domain-containing protein [Anaerostipes caccae]